MEDLKLIEKQIEKYRLTKRHYDLEYWKNPLNGTKESDDIYDQVKENLFKLLDKYPQFKKAEDELQESIYMNTFANVMHKHKMYSLGKALSVDAFLKWLDSTKTKIFNYLNNSFIFELKIDGIAISLEYENGKLIRGSTKGDGVVGDDITPLVFLIDDIPKTLPNNISGEFGGEIYMKKSSLNKLNEKLEKEGKQKLKNVRNTAAGIARQKDTSSRLGAYLSMYCYRFVNDNYEYNTYKEEMDVAKQSGFKTVFHDLNGKFIENINKLTNNDIIKIFTDYRAQRDIIDLDIDGVVIKINDKSIQENLGYKTTIPNWAIAYKFPAMEKITKLLDVTWDYGAKDGRLTPMAEIEPVEIGGTTVKRPTLHNWDELQRLGVKINSIVKVSRRGDVIPKIEEVMNELTVESETKDIELPICPHCEEKTIIEGAYVKCNNNECTGRIGGKVRIFVNTMKIDSLGVATIDKLIENDILKSVGDLFNLKAEDISNLDKMGDKSAKKIIDNINICKQQPLWRVLAGLCIPMVGESTAKSIEKHCNNLQEFANFTIEDLQKIEKINKIEGISKAVEKINNWLSIENNQNLLNELINLGLGTTVEITQVLENKLNGAKIAFTGKLNSFSRNDCIAVIESNGGISWGIKKEIDFLLIGEGAKDAKIEKAEKLGARIISEEEFKNMIK